MKKVLILIITLALLAGCGSKKEELPKEELSKVVVTLDWTPNTNHTGLYVAKDKDFYKDLGLDVEIVQPSSGTAEQLVATDKAQFGVSYQESVTFARLEEVPVVSIAAVIQHNTSGFAALSTKGIKTPKDFEGKKYGGWGSPIEKATLKALMDSVGADVEKVDILSSGATDFFASSKKDIDFAWIFAGWTGIEAKLKGIGIDYISLKDFAPELDYYTPVIITSEKNISENKELVEKFMQATKKGYEFAMKNPEESAEILLANAPELDKDLVVESQKFLAGEYQAEANSWGIQKKSVWDMYTDWLFANGLIENKIDTTKAFTNEFIK